MNRSSRYRSFRHNGLNWTVEETCRSTIGEGLLEMVRQAHQHPECSVLRENNVRASMIVPLPHREKHVFVKRYKCSGITNALKYFILPSKASSEWKTVLALFDRGMPVPRPLGLVEERRFHFLVESYLFTELLTGATPLRTYYQNNLAPPSPRKIRLRRLRLIRKVAGLVALLHNEGFFYRDLHAANILVADRDDQRMDVYPVDFHKSWHLLWIPRFMRIRDLAQLKNSISLSRTDYLRFLREYLNQSPSLSLKRRSAALQIAAKADRLWRTHLKSRTKRCLLESSEFAVVKTSTRSLFYRKSYPRSLIDTIVNKYDTLVRSRNATFLKETPKERVSMVEICNGDNTIKVLVKESRFRGLSKMITTSLSGSRARRSWIAARGMAVRGITTPETLALIEEKQFRLLKRTILLTRFIETASDLNTYVMKHFNSSPSADSRLTKDFFIHSFARQLRALHQEGIYHADLKSNNILVSEGGSRKWDFHFIDLDRVSFKHHLSFRERANNLAQINASISDCITVSERISFFKSYARGTPQMKQAKRLFKRIVAIGKTKNTVPYGVIFSPRKS